MEAAFSARARTEGNGDGYHPIAASGPHATILHWNRNDGELRPGELLLLDAGVETHALYTADVTRTFPVSGRFDALQRQVYAYVLAAQEAGHSRSCGRAPTSVPTTARAPRFSPRDLRTSAFFRSPRRSRWSRTVACTGAGRCARRGT